jgi:hypothetical protein
VGILEVGGRVYQSEGFGTGRCMVRFKCPVCKGESVLNAYFGQPFHHGLCGGAPMEAMNLVREPGSSFDPRGVPNRGSA